MACRFREDTATFFAGLAPLFLAAAVPVPRHVLLCFDLALHWLAFSSFLNSGAPRQQQVAKVCLVEPQSQHDFPLFRGILTATSFCDAKQNCGTNRERKLALDAHINFCHFIIGDEYMLYIWYLETHRHFLEKCTLCGNQHENGLYLELGATCQTTLQKTCSKL